MSYGQFVSNYIGTYGTYNGQYIAAQPQYNLSDGGTKIDTSVINDLTAIAQDPSAYSSALQAQAQAFNALNPTNQPLADNPFGITQEKNDQFQLHDGTWVNVQQFQDMVLGLTSAFGANGGGTAGPEEVFGIKNMAPNFNAINMSELGTYQNGVFTPIGKGGNTPPPGGGNGGGGGGTGGGGTGGGGGGGGGNGGHGGGGHVPHVIVNVNVPNGMLVGQINDLAKIIAQPIANAINGVAYSNKTSRKYKTGAGV
jgi:hypothetical protein